MGDDTLYAYYAGFFEADGCICLTTSCSSYHLRAELTNTNIEFLQLAQHELGMGSITIRTNRPKKWKDAGHLRFNSEETVIFLQNILPYLRFKKEVVEVALEYRKLFPCRKKTKKDMRQVQHSYYEKMKLLNMRGLSS